MAECLEKVGDRRHEIKAIGVSAQQHGLVALDKADEPLRPAKLWSDVSTVEQCEKFNQEFGGADGLIERIGNPMLPGYTAPKTSLVEGKRAGKLSTPNEHFAAARLPQSLADWRTPDGIWRRFRHRPAGRAKPANGANRSWNFIDPKVEGMLPPLRSSKRPAGLLRSVLREKWGLAEDALVSAGSGDNMMSAIGTGNIRAGVMTVSLGTSGTICAFSEEPVVDPKGEIAGFCDATDHWLPLACAMNMTVADGTSARTFPLGNPNNGERGCERSGRRGRDSFPPLLARRTNTKPAREPRSFPWPNDGKHETRFHGACRASRASCSVWLMVCAGSKKSGSSRTKFD